MRKYEHGSNEYPGCKTGEVYLANVIDVVDAYGLGYKKVRVGIGDIAYDGIGQIIPEWYPVFVSKEEYSAKNL